MDTHIPGYPRRRKRRLVTLSPESQDKQDQLFFAKPSLPPTNERRGAMFIYNRLQREADADHCLPAAAPELMINHWEGLSDPTARESYRDRAEELKDKGPTDGKGG